MGGPSAAHPVWTCLPNLASFSGPEAFRNLSKPSMLLTPWFRPHARTRARPEFCCDHNGRSDMGALACSKKDALHMTDGRSKKISSSTNSKARSKKAPSSAIANAGSEQECSSRHLDTILEAV